METNNPPTGYTVENTDNSLPCSSPAISEANYNNLHTFDFDAFCAEDNDTLSLGADYPALQDINFATGEQALKEDTIRRSSLVLAEPRHPQISFHPYVSPIHPASLDLPDLNAYINQQHADEGPLTYSTSHFGGLDMVNGNFVHDEKLWEPLFGDLSPGKDVFFPVHGANSTQAVCKIKPKNTRTLNITIFDPSLFYKPLDGCPKSWSPPNSMYSVFEYTVHGELNPWCEFSREQISDYLTYHPLHRLYNSTTSTKFSGLTIWIQTTPADAGKRYPTNLSSKCRFADCPAKNRTIRNGQFRMAFDEQYLSTQQVDPYHNAGYVHLFCIEKHFDFPRMCKLFNIQGDDRKFPEGRNKMAITRDHSGMLAIVDEFIRSSAPWGDKRPQNWYDHSLSLALTKHHLRHQPKLRQQVREARGGNSIDRHLNNLDVMIKMGEVIREQKAREKKRLRAIEKR